MKRKIKFRGKKIDSDKWLYGDLYRNSYGLTAVIDSSKNDCRTVESDYEVEKNSIGQLVKDFQGKKFFEGDIAVTKDTDEPLRVILTWIEQNAMFAWLTVDEYLYYKHNGKIEMDATLFWTYAFSDDTVKELKIIGNAFDNPGLLNEEFKDAE